MLRKLGMGVIWLLDVMWRVLTATLVFAGLPLATVWATLLVSDSVLPLSSAGDALREVWEVFTGAEFWTACVIAAVLSVLLASFLSRLDSWLPGVLRRWSYWHKIYMERTANASVLSVEDLDEVIHHVYRQAEGQIMLVNPLPALFESRAKPWQDVRAALRKNSKHIDKLVLRVSPGTRASLMAAGEGRMGLNEVIAGKLELEPWHDIQIEAAELDDEEEQLARGVTWGVYCRRRWWRRGTEAEVVLIRPHWQPYDGRYVIVHKRRHMKRMEVPLTGGGPGADTFLDMVHRSFRNAGCGAG